MRTRGSRCSCDDEAGYELEPMMSGQVPRVIKTFQLEAEYVFVLLRVYYILNLDESQPKTAMPFFFTKPTHDLRHPVRKSHETIELEETIYAIPG